MGNLVNFTADYTRYVVKGGKAYYTWLAVLALLSAGALYGFYLQNTEGLIVTGMTSQIHDGLYFANLTDAQRADGYTQVDFKISARIPALGQKWEGFVAVNNLTDKKYETFSKLEWSDGRTLAVGLNGKF